MMDNIPNKIISLRTIKLVTFDATNTILKFRVPPWQHYAAVARDHGYMGSGDGLKHRLHQSFKLMWCQHPNFGRCSIKWDQWWKQVVTLTFQGLLPPKVDVNIIAGKLLEDFKTTKCWSLDGGSCQLLKLLKERCITLGVISNFDPRLHDILDNFKVNMFDFVMTSYEVGYCKPDMRIFNCAIEAGKRQVMPSECMHIGDDFENDYKGAREAGWHAILISKQSAVPAQPQHVFKSIEELQLALLGDRLNGV